MKVVTTFHQPSSVLSSVKCRLSARDTENLVVGKLNKIIVYSIQPHGLQKECSADVRGKVLTIKAIPIPVRVHLRPEII
jgi:DNA damage-binding protein 1